MVIMLRKTFFAVGLCALLCSCGSGTNPDNKKPTDNPETKDNTPQDNTVDEVEPNDSLKQPNLVDLQKTYRGTLGPVVKKGDEDWYVIDAGTEKKRVKVNLSAINDIDLSIVFFNDKSETTAVVNNRGAGKEELVPAYGLFPGKNYLRVREVEKKGKPPVSDEVNPYLLSFEVLGDAPDEEIEPNNVARSASPLTANKEVSGYLAWNKDVDWYQIPTTGIEPGSLMRIDFKGVEGVTPQLTLYDAIVAPLWGPATPVKAEQLTLRNFAIKTGTGFEKYYIVVEAKKDANPELKYTLAVSFEKGSGETELEPNDDRKRATAIDNGQRLGGTLSQNDVDFYKVVADAPAILRVDVDPLPGVDLRIEVQNAEGQKTFAVNSKAKDEGETIPGIAIPMGPSFIKISGGKGEFNNSENYVIAITLTPQDGTMEKEPNATKEEATEIALGLTLSGYMFPAKDVDMYRLDLSQRTDPTSLQITVTGILKVDQSIELRDDTDAVVQAAAKQPAGEDEIIKATLDPGVYQIIIKGPGDNPRDMYQLRVEER
jgi:hypothetical protein